MINVKKIEKELTSLPEGWIGLLETSTEKAMKVNLATLKILTDKNYNGIVLSASRPYSNLVSLYKNNDINIKKIWVIDCISKSQGSKLGEDDNVLYLENVSALTNISISINECIKKIKGKKFIFIDSITTMLIYNKPSIYAKFIHNILTRMRITGISDLLICLEEGTDKEVRAEIAQLCDKVIRI
ncbi:MAG: hypothetical protein AVW06_01240 [Hadesarchaea archaeon DG-33-1]|nr:MAG: hypothetical protein AVW06_01240 [Hadesarchaea archaeon DG-33-1]